MKGSWKTTVSGVLGYVATLCAIGSDYFGSRPIDFKELMGALLGIAVSSGLIAARDNGVRSETVGAK